MDVFFLDFSVKEVTNRIRIEITYRIQIHKRFLGSKNPKKTGVPTLNLFIRYTIGHIIVIVPKRCN